MTDMFTVLVAASYGILLLASGVTFFGLKKNPANVTLGKVKIIVKTWWVIVTFLLVVIGTAPVGLIIGFLILTLLGIREYYRISRIAESKTLLAILVSFTAVAEYALLWFSKFEIFQFFPIVILLIMLPPLLLFKTPSQRLPEMVATTIGPLFLFHFLACLPALYMFVLRETGKVESAQLFVFTLIFLTIANDVFQFIFGKLFGKRKIVPSISPNKTEAGFIGGLFATCFFALMILHFVIEMAVWKAVVIGALISVYGMQGDLLFSHIKRYFEVKDFSAALPGHGGYLDRMDSLILTTPAVYYGFYFIAGGF